MPSIKFKDFSVSYKKKSNSNYILKNLNFELEDSSFNLLVGYSGEGKTTLLKCISGLMEYEGKILFNDVDASDFPVSERSIAYVSQEYVLFPHMSVFDNIAFPLINIGTPKKEIIRRVNEVSEKLGISCCLTRKPKHISGGQQQRVALARALVKKPSIILFDEPLSNFDYEARVEAKRLIRKVCSEVNATVVYVTHNLAESVSLADKVIVINNKKIEFIGNQLETIHTENKVVNSLLGDKND